MAYDFEFLENFVFRMPSVRRLFAYILIVSVLSSYLISVSGGFLVSKFMIVLALLFSGVSVISLVASSHISYISREWSLLVSSIVLSAFFLFQLATFSVLSGDLSMLLSLAGALMASMLSYTVVAGKENIFKIALISSAPVALFTFVMINFWPSKLTNSILLIYLGSLLLVLCLNKLLNEYFFQVNSLNISGAVLGAEIINDIQCDLDMGEQSKATVRTFEIRNDNGETFTGFIPWIHPGPIASFGGSRIQERTIDESNNDFFLHAPSTHESDLTSVRDMEKVLDKFDSPERYGETASRLLKVESQHFNVYGRSYEDKKVLYLESDDFDDYERSIFDSRLEEKDIAVVDTHGGDRKYGKAVNHGSMYAEELKHLIDTIITELDNSEQYTYRAGWSVIQNEKDIMAMTEEVDGQKVLFLGTNENEKSEEMLEAETRFEDDFDQVIVFTTDNHRSIYDQAVGLPNSANNYKQAVEEAEDSLKKSEAGLRYDKVEDVRLFNEHYFELMGSINILSRLYPTTVMIITFTFILLAVRLI